MTLLPHGWTEADAHVCGCGNSASDDGFYPVNSRGEFVEPTYTAWDTDEYACSICGVRHRLYGNERVQVIDGPSVVIDAANLRRLGELIT